MPRTKKASTKHSATKINKHSATKINKSEWIRSQPGTMAAKEVLTKAASEGIKLSVAQIYAARSSAKKSVAPKGKARSAKGLRGSAAKSARKGGDDELAFRRLVVSIGLPAAEGYMAELKRSVGL